MLTERLHTSKYSFFDRLLALDYFLIFIVITIGAVSVFAIHSTESGEFSYYTKNHLIRLVTFFLMFLFLSFVKITFWYRNAYIFYLICLFLLIVVLFFGITASGSKRWVNLYFLNLQPSELMKIAIIVCFARYYHRMQSADIQSYRYLLIPVILLILGVIGSIYTGIATATEAASLGVVGALILSYFQKSLTYKTFKDSLLGATKTSCMIAFILAGATFLSLAMGFTGLPRNLALWIQNMELSPYVLIFVLMIFYIILGMFLDGISAVVLTMAIIEPMIRQAGFDMIWFGIFLVIVVEMAQITPPVGFNLFVLQGMANKDMGFIAKSAFPLFLLMIFAVLLIVLFPQIALWMPEQMIQNIN